MYILLLILLLQLKHCYADFVIQTYSQTVRKGIYRDLVGLSHTLDHMISTIFVLFVFSFWYSITPVVILITALLEGVAHYHIDWFKVKYGCKDISSPKFWTQFGLDQLAHQITYLLIVLCLLKDQIY
jgi:hypothetical protein